ncbi:MAG: DUF3011 domain-containing protein [Arenimonas sp.]
MIPDFRAKFLLGAVLAAAGLMQATPALAQYSSDQVRSIESEYSRTHSGRPISDSQLEYYLDRMDSGWSMQRVIADIDSSGTSPWRPSQGWVAREVVCSSIESRYAECRVPFQGSAMLTQQISNSACIEGRTWGQKPGAVWVDHGCRARFGIVGNRGPLPPERTVRCNSYKGRYRECATNIRGSVYLKYRNPNSWKCTEGRTWGQRRGVVWVRGNCRATFSSMGRSVPRDDAGGWTRRPNYAVTCSSIDGRRSNCSWDDRYGTPRIIHQISSSQCIEGRDWGYMTGGGLWVNSGCRATFGYADARYSDYGYRDMPSTAWVRDPNYSVTCSSTNSGRTMCTWDDRYGTPRLVRQISSSQCVEGRDWGYDRNGQLWVTSGCRATFGYGDYRDSGTSNWVRDPNYSVTCSSTNSGRQVCEWDYRYGNPYLRQQVSSSACVEGRDWGYSRDGGLWVTSGCRATFGYR